VTLREITGKSRTRDRLRLSLSANFRSNQNERLKRMAK
jgi:hypothetical protein